MKINWEVRIKNRLFWACIIPAGLLVVQAVAAVFGYALDLGSLGDKLLAVVESVFGFLAVLGIVTDHTTKGISDSEQALTYNKPK